MTPKPIHATFAMSLSSCVGVSPLAPSSMINKIGRGEGSDPFGSTRLLSDGAAVVRRDRGAAEDSYSAGVLRYGVSPAFSEVEGTPMMAAPSRAATAVTASRAVFRFTAGLLDLDGMKSVCRLVDSASKLSR